MARVGFFSSLRWQIFNPDRTLGENSLGHRGPNEIDESIFICPTLSCVYALISGGWRNAERPWVEQIIFIALLEHREESIKFIEAVGIWGRFLILSLEN